MSETLRTLNTDMWAILSAKSEGEAEEKLESCTQGEGLWAYVRIHSWFTRTTDQGRSMRRAAIMQPPKCTHEHEISAAIERWEEKYRALRDDDREMELPDSWKMIALRMMLCGEIQKSVEYREKEFHTYEELRGVVMKWAINQKIENERSQRNFMDCNHAQNWDMPSDWNWNNDSHQTTTADQPINDLNYVNKGKGKGKGKGDWGPTGGKGASNQQNPIQYYMMMAMKAMKGMGKGGSTQSNQSSQGKDGGGKSGGKGCFNCGQLGHMARNCPHPPKCNRCGKTGHLAKDCRAAIPTREVAAEEESDDVVWGTCVIDELQDIDAAEKKKASSDHKAVTEPALTAKPWRKKIQGGHRLKFVLDSGAVKTIVPKDAIPGMKLDKSKGGSFRVADGTVIPNL